jgi:hypothetical protein
VLYFRVLSDIFLDTERSHKKAAFRVLGNPFETRTRFLPKTNIECHCYVNQLSEFKRHGIER